MTTSAKAETLRQIGWLEHNGNLAEARSVCSDYLKKRGNDPDIRTALGRLLMMSGRFFDALQHFTKALSRVPDSPEFMVNLAVAWMQVHRPDYALPLALKARGIEPRNASIVKLQIEALIGLGRADEAISVLETAAGNGLDSPEFTADLARLYYMNGDPAEAARAYRRLIAAGYASANALLGLVQSIDPGDGFAEDAIVLQAAERRNNSVDDQSKLNLAAAMIHDARGDFEKAFAHYSFAAAVDRKGYQAARAMRRQLRRLTQRFTAEKIAGNPVSASRSDKPVFVFGMPRSGTTLVEQILASHPMIHGADELMFFQTLDQSLDGEYPREREAKSAAKEYLALLRAFSPEARHVVDKMPDNFSRLWLLAALFPNAKFIHCKRDPVATCVSIFTNPLGARHAYASSLGELGKYYRTYRELMEHWKDVLPISIHEVAYEDLVEAPETEIHRLIDYVGVPWDDACLTPERTRRAVQTPSRRQVSKPINRSALERWKRFDPYLGPLKDALGDP